MGIGGIKFWTKDESNKLFKQAGFKVEEQITRGIVCFTRLRAS
jgi:citrate lyase synthetase